MTDNKTETTDIREACHTPRRRTHSPESVPDGLICAWSSQPAHPEGRPGWDRRPITPPEWVTARRSAAAALFAVQQKVPSSPIPEGRRWNSMLFIVSAIGIAYVDRLSNGPVLVPNGEGHNGHGGAKGHHGH